MFSEKSELTVESVLKNHQSEVSIVDKLTILKNERLRIPQRHEYHRKCGFAQRNSRVETEETEIENAASKNKGNVEIGDKTTISLSRKIGETVREISFLFQSVVCDNLSDSILRNVLHSADLQAEIQRTKDETKQTVEKSSDVYTLENKDSESNSDENDEYAEERNSDEASEKISNCRDPETVVQQQTEQNKTNQASRTENSNRGVPDNAVAEHLEVNEINHSPSQQHLGESGNISPQPALEQEELVDESYAYAPIDCWLCGKKLVITRLSAIFFCRNVQTSARSSIISISLLLLSNSFFLAMNLMKLVNTFLLLTVTPFP